MRNYTSVSKIFYDYESCNLLRWSVRCQTIIRNDNIFWNTEIQTSPIGKKILIHAWTWTFVLTYQNATNVITQIVSLFKLQVINIYCYMSTVKFKKVKIPFPKLSFNILCGHGQFIFMNARLDTLVHKTCLFHNITISHLKESWLFNTFIFGKFLDYCWQKLLLISRTLRMKEICLD